MGGGGGVRVLDKTCRFGYCGVDASVRPHLTENSGLRHEIEQKESEIARLEKSHERLQQEQEAPSTGAGPA